MSDEDEAAGLLELQALERGLAAALRASDRAGGRASLAATPGLSARGRARVASSGISADGFEMAALLVARLRFERLMQGSEAASRWFDADPAGFAASFRAYHAATPASGLFPADEAALFAGFLAETREDGA